MPEFRYLRSLVALADERHVTRAAKRVGLTQSALSQQLHRFEAELGIALAVRRTRDFHLTEAGEQLARDARPLLLRIDSILADAVRTGRGEGARILVGYVPSTNPGVLVAALKALEREAPTVRVSLRELSSAEQIAALRGGELDVGLVRTGDGVEDLWLTPLREERMVVAMRPDHPVADREQLSLSELVQECFIVPGRGGNSPARADLRAACLEHGYEPDIRHEASVALSLRLVARGLGIALVPEGVIADSPETVAAVPTGTLSRTLFVATHPNRQRDAVRSFVDALRAG